VTPATNFSGTLSVPVAVSDGHTTSAPFAVQVTVTAVNDPPGITGQAVLSSAEETPVALALSSLQVTDPDNAYPLGFTLTVQPGANYTVAGTVVTPATDFEGNLLVPVAVN